MMLAQGKGSAHRLAQAVSAMMREGDIATTIARLAVPALGDLCVIGVLHDSRPVRHTFAHRNPAQSAAIEALGPHLAGVHEFPEGRRALAGESVIFQFTQEHLRFHQKVSAPGELVRRLNVGWVMHLPIIVMGRTVAVAGFARTADAGLRLQPGDLALAEEMMRQVITRYAGFNATREGSHEDPRFRRVEEFISDNLGSSFSLEVLARRAGLSKFHFLRLFKEVYGETPFRRLTRLRMQEAQRRLARGGESVTEIAFACGYENSAHFASAFRRVVGVSPTTYRRHIR